MSSTLNNQAQINAWYRGNAADPASVAADSYNNAVAYFEKELTETESDTSWIRAQCSLKDVQSTVAAAQSNYDKEHEKHAGPRKSINALASTVVNYGKVLDVLSAAEPLYAGLAWGAIKFLVSGLTQHAKLVSELTTALATIGEALPRVEISIILYNTAPMQQVIAKAYAHILLFLQRAISWYRASRPRRAYLGIIKPLYFIDIVCDIKGCIEGVGLVAAAAQAAEIRGQSNSLELMGGQMLQVQGDTSQIPLLRVEIKQALQEVMKMPQIQGNTSQIPHLRIEIEQVLQEVMKNRDFIGSVKLDTTDSQSRLCSMQVSQTMKILKPKQLPEALLLECESLAQGRAPWAQQGRDSAGVLQSLETWAASSTSASLTVRAAPSAASRMRDLVLEVIQKLKRNGEPVLWFMSYGLKDTTDLTPISIISGLIYQALQRATSVSSRNLQLCDLQTYQTAVTLHRWIELATAVFSSFDFSYLVLEVDALCQLSGSTDLLRQCHQALETIFENVSAEGTVVKLFVVTNSPGMDIFRPSQGSHTEFYLSAPTPVPRKLPSKARPGPVS